MKMKELYTGHEEEMNALQDQDFPLSNEEIAQLKISSIKEAIERFEFSQNCTDEEWKNDEFNRFWDDETPRITSIDLIDRITRIVSGYKRNETK
jgi:hypothetical protein